MANNGTDTKINVIISGGVMTAAMSIMKMMACLRYFDIWEALRIPILESINAITGNWNTTPNSSVSDTNVET